ncbi:MAG TPA: cupredoxin domain-containing protein [Verrucomicrobiae bacterium]|nr:cupredoxin domain-containing protein [Verrucomicrobiae bacterium]
MNNRLVAAVVVVIIAVGAYLLFANNNNNQNNTNGTQNNGNNNNVTPPPPPPPSAQPSPSPSSTQPLTGEVVVEYTTSGYSPSTFTVKKGTKVTFTNKTTGQMWPASAPHPTHTNYPEFDPKQAIAANQSWSFTLDKTGKWNFHDHLFPSRFGSVTVVE